MWGRPSILLATQRVQQREDGGADRHHFAVAVDDGELALRLVVLMDRADLLVERHEALAHHLLLVVGALHEVLARLVVLPGHLGRVVDRVVRAARLAVDPAAGGALDDHLIGDLERDDLVDRDAALLHLLGLRQRAREAIDDVALLALGRLHRVLDDAKDDVVGDEGARVHGGLGALAVLRLGGDGGAEHVAGGQVAHVVALHHGGALRALAAARRAHHDDLHG
mmetsp:Transcript_5651/g.17792  ORF Transcript_5651/g.17792 Transcript_5651/m.17792 type:complete len:224 (-) Transcript_5651:32-703(-)